MGRPKKIQQEIKEIQQDKKEGAPVDEEKQKLLDRLEQLEKRDAENQEKIKMLYEVSDKGRVFNYESKKSAKKPFKVKLSAYKGGIIIGWRTVKDILIKNPTTGLTVGEEQQYEVVILDRDGTTRKDLISGYPAFSEARYTERIEAEVIGRREDYQGNIDFDLLLSDGRQVPLNSKFVN